MPFGSTVYFGKERVFVDREACIQAFKKNIQESVTKEHNILFFHGIAGIGKSKLQKELQKILNEEYPDIFWVAIDLETKTYREISTFLMTLRNKIQEKYKAKFYLFNTAHAIYWKKLHPEIPLLKENYPLIKEGKFFSKLIDILNEFGPARLTWDIIKSAPESVIKFFVEQLIDINKLTAMEAHELEKLLPGYFAADFINHLGKDSKAYIFIDTYEALWEDLRNKGSFYEKDQWIRERLILNMPGVSWVICGREKLQWNFRFYPECEICFEQHSINELPGDYCKEFLEECGIENKEIQNIILETGEGVPYYLNLSVDTFERIYNKREPILEDFGKTQPEIFSTFVKYLDINEIRTFEILSALNFWDRDLFEILMKRFDPGVHTGAFSELVKFSFIKMDTEGKYFIHKLMRNSLQEHQDSIEIEGVHKFMFEHYNNKLKAVDIKMITPEHETALTEAFYHAKKILGVEELLKWFISASDPFYKAAFWKLIIPPYEEILKIIETKFSSEQKLIAASSNYLAELYRQTGDYEKAHPLYQRALDINKKLDLCPEVAITLNNFAALYRQMGDYNKALRFYQQALDINEKLGGTRYTDIAITLNNLAELYRQMGDYEAGLSHYIQALYISKKVLGPQHPEVAKTLNNIATLYYHSKMYEEALLYFEQSLKILETKLGPAHPDFKITEKNVQLVKTYINQNRKTSLSKTQK